MRLLTFPCSEFPAKRQALAEGHQPRCLEQMAFDSISAKIKQDQINPLILGGQHIENIRKEGVDKGDDHFLNFFFSLFHLKLAPSRQELVYLCFFAADFKSPPFLGALESHCTSAKHHSCLPENKNRRERSGQRIKARGGFVWQIVAGVLPLQTLSPSLCLYVSLCAHHQVPPSHCQLENYRS